MDRLLYYFLSTLLFGLGIIFLINSLYWRFVEEKIEKTTSEIFHKIAIDCPSFAHIWAILVFPIWYLVTYPPHQNIAKSNLQTMLLLLKAMLLYGVAYGLGHIFG